MEEHTSFTCLDFNDDEDFNTTERGCYGSERFMAFVDRVLFTRDSSDIQQFRLAIRYPDGLARIDGWIWTAVRRNVVELDFHFQTDELLDFELPRSLVMCKTLMVLRLSSSILTHALLNPGYFPFLKFHHVTVCYFDNDMISKLFSDRPLLEGLTIDGGIRAKEVLNFMISAPKLKTLQISLSVDSPHYVYNPSIDAPMLGNLDIELDTGKLCFGECKISSESQYCFRRLLWRTTACLFQSCNGASGTSLQCYISVSFGLLF